MFGRITGSSKEEEPINCIHSGFFFSLCAQSEDMRKTHRKEHSQLAMYAFMNVK